MYLICIYKHIYIFMYYTCIYIQYMFASYMNMFGDSLRYLCVCVFGDVIGVFEVK